MKVKQNDKSINITIKDDSQTFYYLKSIIDKNFKNKIGSKNKIIVFNDSYEEIGRKYFLKLLSRIYARKTDKKLKKIWQIEKAYNKIIKITLLKENQIQNIVNFKVNFCKKSGNIELKMDMKNRLILRGLQNIFDGYKVLYQPSSTTVLIYDFDKTVLQKLKELILTKEILGNFIHFHYDKKIFDEIKSFLSGAPKRRKCINLLLEDFYKMLNCSQKDSYEKIRANYLNLAKKYHPDNILSDNTLIIKVYSKKFQKIQQAYKTIKEYHKYIGNVA